jgi:hypothetical protein
MDGYSISLEIKIGHENPNYPRDDTDAYMELFVEHAMEIQKAMEKCEHIETIDGRVVQITKLELSGNLHIDHFFLTYSFEGQEYKHGFDKETFYKL